MQKGRNHKFADFNPAGEGRRGKCLVCGTVCLEAKGGYRTYYNKKGIKHETMPHCSDVAEENAQCGADIKIVITATESRHQGIPLSEIVAFKDARIKEAHYIIKLMYLEMVAHRKAPPYMEKLASRFILENGI